MCVRKCIDINCLNVFTKKPERYLNFTSKIEVRQRWRGVSVSIITKSHLCSSTIFQSINNTTITTRINQNVLSQSKWMSQIHRLLWIHWIPSTKDEKFEFSPFLCVFQRKLFCYLESYSSAMKEYLYCTHSVAFSTHFSFWFYCCCFGITPDKLNGNSMNMVDGRKSIQQSRLDDNKLLDAKSSSCSLMVKSFTIHTNT